MGGSRTGSIPRCMAHVRWHSSIDRGRLRHAEFGTACRSVGAMGASCFCYWFRASEHVHQVRPRFPGHSMAHRDCRSPATSRHRMVVCAVLWGWNTLVFATWHSPEHRRACAAADTTPSSIVMSTITPNNRVERTAAIRLDFDGDGLQTAVIAVVSALPAAVAHPCRSPSQILTTHPRKMKLLRSLTTPPLAASLGALCRET